MYINKLTSCYCNLKQMECANCNLFFIVANKCRRFLLFIVFLLTFYQQQLWNVEFFTSLIFINGSLLWLLHSKPIN